MTYYMTGPEGDKHAGYWQITGVDEPRSFSFVDGFADLDFNPNPDHAGLDERLHLRRARRRHPGGVRERYESAEALQQVLDMGIVEGASLAINQIDDLIAELSPHPPAADYRGRWDPRGGDMPFGADQAAVDRVTAQLAGVGRLGVAFSGGVDSATLLALAVRALGPARVLGGHRRLPEPGRRRAGGGARRRPLRRRPGGRGRHPRGGAGRPTAPTARTAASTARTSCSPASTTRCARSTGSTRWRTGRTPTTCGARTGRAPGPPPGTACCARWPTPGWTRPRCGGSRAVLALPCADKPAAPCLASRIPHHEPVTPEKLAQVEAAERALRELGFRDCRVRHHGDVARVELPADDIARAAAGPLRAQVHEAVARGRVPVRGRRPGRDPVGRVHAAAGGRPTRG